jgi:hypothetical protein
MQGKIKIKGNMALAMKLQVILDAAKKQLSAAPAVSKVRGLSPSYSLY